MRYISSELQSFAAYGTAKDIVKLYKEAGFTAYDASMFTGGVFDEILYGDITLEVAYAPKKTPKALLAPLAKYLAEITNYFKNELDK